MVEFPPSQKREDQLVWVHIGLTDPTTCGFQASTNSAWILPERIFILQNPSIRFGCERPGKHTNTEDPPPVGSRDSGKHTHVQPAGHEAIWAHTPGGPIAESAKTVTHNRFGFMTERC